MIFVALVFMGDERKKELAQLAAYSKTLGDGEDEEVEWWAPRAVPRVTPTPRPIRR